MADTKKLVLVVESTAALDPHWPTILSDYLLKVIRSFCGHDTTNPDSPIAEMALMTFSTRGRYNLSRSSIWIDDMDVFLEWLSDIRFNEDGYSDSVIAKRLAEVLMMFHPVHEIQNQQNAGLQNHCILVAASEPYPMPSQLYRPPDYLGIPSENGSTDVETIAEYFKQYLVSLSVICPSELPKLKAIYNAGKRNPNAIDHTVDIVEIPNYQVLVSEDFMEARAALIRQPENTNFPSNQSPMLIDSSSSEPTTMASASSSSLPGTSTGMQSVNDDVATNVGPVDPTMFVKIWEGDLLASEKEGQPVFITRLQGYKRREACETLANDWPSTIQIDSGLPQEKLIKEYDYVYFTAMNEHDYLKQMQQHKLISAVKLPSQTLILFSKDNPCLLLGKVFPRDMSEEGDVEGAEGDQMEM